MSNLNKLCIKRERERERERLFLHSEKTIEESNFTFQNKSRKQVGRCKKPGSNCP